METLEDKIAALEQSLASALSEIRELKSQAQNTPAPLVGGKDAPEWAPGIKRRIA